MSEIKLLRCPFCGGEAEFATSHKRWVQCKECLAESVYCDTPEQAIAAWNNRKPVEDVLERLEEEYKAASDDMKRCLRENPLQFDSAKGCAQGLYNAIKIIKERML